MQVTQNGLGRLAFGLMLGAMLMALSGCLVAGSAKQERTGKYVADTTFNQIEPGSTYIIFRNGNSWKFGGRKRA